MGNLGEKLEFAEIIEKDIQAKERKLEKELEEAQRKYVENKELIHNLGIKDQLDSVALAKRSTGRKAEVHFSSAPEIVGDEAIISDCEITLVWGENAEYKDEKGRSSKGVQDKSISVKVCDTPEGKLFKIRPGSSRGRQTIEVREIMMKELDNALIYAYECPDYAEKVRPLHSRQA
ncbi:MAG: hypothetical protein Q8P80_04470 [Candidatus Levybacteria bacterium]|nr:hypothetical protein [Candidatus Levybacteria bacterium]